MLSLGCWAEPAERSTCQGSLPHVSPICPDLVAKSGTQMSQMGRSRARSHLVGTPSSARRFRIPPRLREAGARTHLALFNALNSSSFALTGRMMTMVQGHHWIDISSRWYQRVQSASKIALGCQGARHCGEEQGAGSASNGAEALLDLLSCPSSISTTPSLHSLRFFQVLTAA